MSCPVVRQGHGTRTKPAAELFLGRDSRHAPTYLLFPSARAGVDRGGQPPQLSRVARPACLRTRSTAAHHLQRSLPGPRSSLEPQTERAFAVMQTSLQFRLLIFLIGLLAVLALRGLKGLDGLSLFS